MSTTLKIQQQKMAVSNSIALPNFTTIAARNSIFISFNQLSVQKTGINYPDLEPGNKFWNRVWVQITTLNNPINHFYVKMT